MRMVRANRVLYRAQLRWLHEEPMPALNSRRSKWIMVLLWPLSHSKHAYGAAACTKPTYENAGCSFGGSRAWSGSGGGWFEEVGGGKSLLLPLLLPCKARHSLSSLSLVMCCISKEAQILFGITKPCQPCKAHDHRVPLAR
jgi:hypothetical protein